MQKRLELLEQAILRQEDRVNDEQNALADTLSRARGELQATLLSQDTSSGTAEKPIDGPALDFI